MTNLIWLVLMLVSVFIAVYVGYLLANKLLVNQFKQQIVNLENTINQLKSELNDANSQKLELEKNLDTIKETLNQCQIELSKVSTAKNMLEESFQSISEEYNDLKNQNSQLQNQIVELTGKYNAAKSVAEQYDELNEQYKDAQKQIQELIGKNEKLEEEKKQIEIRTQRELELAKENFEQRIGDLEKLKSDLEKEFNNISQMVLDKNTDRFFKTATEHLKLVEEKIKNELSNKTEKVETIIKPVDESIKNLNALLKELEIKREKAYTEIDTHVKTLSTETQNLIIALRKPQSRGRWGELQLRNAVELAGLKEHCDFIEQQQYKGSDADRRPDLIVKLPGGRVIAVDAKVPLDDYLAAVEAKTEEEKKAHMKTHAKKIEQHIKDLASKEYQSNIGTSVDFVVLFIPGENFFSAALEANKDLIEFGLKNKVLISSPTTLIALLKAIAYGWQQEKVQRNIEEIKIEANRLYERILKFMEYFAKLGKKLNELSNTYNEAQNSYHSRLLPSLNKFKQLGVSNQDMPQIEIVQNTHVLDLPAAED